MGLVYEYVPGQTPLSEEEKEGLLAKTISTKQELDELEQLNIQEGTEWTLPRKFHRNEILSEEFTNQLYWNMYGNVWKWAGQFRKSDKNIGSSWYRIPVDLKNLIDDCKYWIDEKVYPPDEIAVRFKHRVVSIHCYPNGNGRHSRLMADVIINHVFNKTYLPGVAQTLLQKAGQDMPICRQ